MKIFCY